MLKSNRRLSNRIYGMLLEQQSTLDRIENGRLLASNTIVDARLFDQVVHRPAALTIKHATFESGPVDSRNRVSRAQKRLPWTVLYDQKGVSAQLTSLPCDKGTVYRAALHISLFDKMYSIHLQFSRSVFSFDRVLHVQNIVAGDAPFATACRVGDFETVRKLLLRDGFSSTSAVTSDGVPMLEVSRNCYNSEIRGLTSAGSMPLAAALPGLFDCFSNMAPTLT